MPAEKKFAPSPTRPKVQDPNEPRVQHMENAYFSLAVQIVISAVVMYLVMFVMIDRLDSFYNNLNMLYMTLMMVAPMVVLMVLAMRHMFPSSATNAILLAGAVAVFFGSFALIRTQTTIGDKAFLRSMIPHHSGAVLMCRRRSAIRRSRGSAAKSSARRSGRSMK